MPPANNEQQQVALVTGASRGIGAATARELARRGYALVLAARSQQLLAELAQECRQAGVPALAVPTDLSSILDVERLARIAQHHFGRVDLVIHNAGLGGSGKLLAQSDPNAIRELLAVNLDAPLVLTRALLPHMIERRSGTFVFVGSVVGRVAVPTSVAYSASKHGLRGFALALRREVRRYGIGVTLVAPGFVATDMTARLRGIPKIPPERVARVIADAAMRPRREIVTPWYYRPICTLETLFPWAVDVALRMWAR